MVSAVVGMTFAESQIQPVGLCAYCSRATVLEKLHAVCIIDIIRWRPNPSCLFKRLELMELRSVADIVWKKLQWG